MLSRGMLWPCWYRAARTIAVEQLLVAQQETSRLLAELVTQGRGVLIPHRDGTNA